MTIRRIVLIKLSSDFSHQAGRRCVVEEARRVFPTIPGVRSVSAGEAADEGALEAWDVALIVELENLEAYDTYRDAPPHRAFVDDFLKPKGEVLKAWNFDFT